MEVFFVRHGKTNNNTLGRNALLGTDDGLNSIGQEQIFKTAKILQRNKIQKIITSWLRRTDDFGRVIAEILDIPHETNVLFRERQWGEWASKTWGEMSAYLDPLTIDECYTILPEGGESWQDMESRLVRGTMGFFDGDETRVAVVTHNGCLRAILPRLLGRPLSEHTQFSVETGSVTHLHYDDDTMTWHLVKFNELPE